MQFRDPDSDFSERKLMATFTTKDRDEAYMQIFLIVFSIVAALFFSALFRGCGLGL